MKIFYRRRSPSRRETAASVLAAASVGAVTYYLARTLLARDPVPASLPARVGSRAAPAHKEHGLAKAPEARSE